MTPDPKQLLCDPSSAHRIRAADYLPGAIRTLHRLNGHRAGLYVGGRPRAAGHVPAGRRDVRPNTTVNGEPFSRRDGGRLSAAVLGQGDAESPAVGARGASSGSCQNHY